MSAIALRPTTALADRLYVGHPTPSGTWILRVLTHEGADTLLESGSERAMAEAMLGDAFPGHLVRADLLDALVAEWQPPDGGFVLPADLVAGWSLRWALAQT